MKGKRYSNEKVKIPSKMTKILSKMTGKLEWNHLLSTGPKNKQRWRK